MEIPNPKANKDDIVLVENYRCKPPKIEPGRVVALGYKNRLGFFRWSYEVSISKRNTSYRIYVGDEGIKETL